MNKDTLDHEKISPTAKLVAYWRKSSDIPYSEDVAQSLMVEECKNLFPELFESAPEFFLSPLLELRYKCIEQYIIKNGFSQVLEFASGIALRGLAMTQNRSLTYIETDLLELTEEKIKLVSHLQKKYALKTDQVHFKTVNILNYEEIMPILELFDRKKPLLIVHEGLFQYLSKPEKKQATKNIHRIFNKFKGVWITPDFDTAREKDSLKNKPVNFQHFGDVIKDTTGRSFEENAFSDDKEIRDFFSTEGFTVDFMLQLDLNAHLSTLNPTNASMVNDFLSHLRLWSLTPSFS